MERIITSLIIIFRRKYERCERADVNSAPRYRASISMDGTLPGKFSYVTYKAAGFLFSLRSDTGFFENPDVRFEEIYRERPGGRMAEMRKINTPLPAPRRNNIPGIREKAAPSKNIDTLTKEKSLAAYCRAMPGGTTEAARHLRRLILTGFQFYQALGKYICIGWHIIAY